MTGSVIQHGDAADFYGEWPSPTVIVSDGAYGLSSFDGDPKNVSGLAHWYRPHIEAWAQHATPETTLWFWCTELGWANIHHVLESFGWQYQAANVWDKGLSHIAGNSNTESIGRFPQVTELCVQYTRPAYGVDHLQDYLRGEWKRAGLTFAEGNDAAGVKDAASRRWFANDEQFCPPPLGRMERLVEYANQNGDPDGRPYYDRLELERSKFDCPAGVTNVWREPPVGNGERLAGESGTAHPNQKPLALMERIIDASSDPVDVVWEPFGGLCTASVAAARLDRRPFAAEVQREYVEIARRRVRNATKIQGVGQEKLGAYSADGGFTYVADVGADGGDD